MGKKKKPAPADAPPEASGPFHTGLAGLAALRDGLAPGNAPDSDDETTAPPAMAAPPRLAGRLVARTERKGHGGKTVTLLLGLRADDAQRRELARELSRSLGCAARVDGERLVLSGDLRERLAQWLDARGADVRAV